MCYYAKNVCFGCDDACRWVFTSVHSRRKKYECHLLNYACITRVKSIQEEYKEQQRQTARVEREKKEKWGKARIKCEDYIDYLDGIGWFATGYGNRLYDRCVYDGHSGCWEWAHRVSECVKRECMFAPVYYDEEHSSQYDAYITKSQFDKCF